MKLFPIPSTPVTHYRIGNFAARSTCLSLLVIGGFGCANMPVKRITVGAVEESNLSIYLFHEAAEPRWLDVRLFVDGREVCPRQDVFRQGAPFQLRNIKHEVKATVEKGKHTLHVEALGGLVSGEADFIANDRIIHAYVYYVDSIKTSDDDAITGELGIIEIAFRDREPLFG